MQTTISSERRRIMKTARILSIVLLLATLSGCASLCEVYNGQAMQVRNKMMAHHAWHRWRWCYEDMPCRADFARGFKDGYKDVMKGGTGCQPVMPPRFYWSVHYQNADGHCHINAWFEGYTHGAMGAAQDGYASSGRVPISPTARQNWIRQQQNFQERQAQQNRAYYDSDLEPIEAPNFGRNPGPVSSGGAPGSSNSGDVVDPPIDIEAPPRPYEEGARYDSPASQQYLNPLPPVMPRPMQYDPVQTGLPIAPFN
jgi:hypothetical protein